MPCVLDGSSIVCLNDDDPLRGSLGKLLFRLDDLVVVDATDCDGRNAITPPLLMLQIAMMMMHDVSNSGRLIVAFL